MKLQVPSGLAVFKDLIELEMNTVELLNMINSKTLTFEIKVTKVRIPNRILQLKAFML
jgi:hypothetical protein